MSASELALLRLGYRSACAERDTLRAEVERLQQALAEQPDSVAAPRELLAELRKFTLEYDSGRAGVLRGHIDALLRGGEKTACSCR